MIRNSTTRLFLCGLSILFWELVLIRWLGSCIRIVAYYTNFVLIAGFLGLGIGTILSRYRFRLDRLLAPLAALCVTSAVFIGSFPSSNPKDPEEYIWIGKPRTLSLLNQDQIISALPYGFPLIAVFLLTVLFFTAFGQLLGRLFQTTSPLKGYSIEVAGSLAGILLFGVLSYVGVSPLLWMSLGFVFLFVLTEPNRKSQFVLVACAGISIAAIAGFTNRFIWSPYYKIQVTPLTSIFDLEEKKPKLFDKAIGYEVTVNNDYHQMMLDLTPREGEHAFIKSWRRLYEAPYVMDHPLPDGPILILGAGTGNDVMGAIRKTDRAIYAVDIDSTFFTLRKAAPLENPYSNPRVTMIEDDARSFMQKTPIRFAMIVFGFLDSHTLLSSFSSLRLDNFVYTKESFQQAKNILMPGGAVTVTFASNTMWLHQRFLSFMAESFGPNLQVFRSPISSYPNGTIYRSFKGTSEADLSSGIEVPSDDWPFLYLASRKVPSQYQIFLLLIVVMGFVPLVLLPKGERKIRFPFFFMGAGFFLLETSNVVTLSLLYGSTWIVNMLVFAAILTFILLGNLASQRIQSVSLPLLFLGLMASLAFSYWTPTSLLLGIGPQWLKAILAALIFLGPVFFAALIFARLILHEQAFYQAYGSNILGAVVGGATEYTSMLFGFKFLLIFAMIFYVLVFSFSACCSERR